jgi:hypothetical protein
MIDKFFIKKPTDIQSESLSEENNIIFLEEARINICS